ncbi:MAG: class I SAM-dependent methyltransferase [Chloroflexi bacterium]|nr:MAG: class I SAM-dependent methyltransferase [Chloroflexota bacterium]
MRLRPSPRPRRGRQISMRHLREELSDLRRSHRGRQAGMTEAERIAKAYRELESVAAARYDLRNRGNQEVLAERRTLTRSLLDRGGWIPFGERRVLEVGCGTGSELAWLLTLGAAPDHLTGVDLLPDRITAARYAYPQFEFHVGNAERLDFAESTFDMVMAITVFSSILDRSMAAGVASEIVRVLRPGGGLLWYDFRYNSPANVNVRGVTARRVRELFPQLDGRLHTVTVIPPLVRRLGPLTPIAYPVLALAPPLRSHLLGVLNKPA